MPRPQLIVLVSTLARLGLAAVWIWSGLVKALNPVDFRFAVTAYDLLPTDIVRPFALTLPIVEIVLGLLLLAGIATRAVAVASALLLLVLIAAIVSAWARNLQIDCGCFGGGGYKEMTWWSYASEVLRDIGFLALALWLAWFPHTRLAVGPGSQARPREFPPVPHQ